MLSVCLPGTGGMVPLENRWLTCCWAEYQGKGILIDCGEGTQIALRAAGCRLSRLELLLITHYHADHIAGLPGLLLTLGNGGKTTPLCLAGPKGLRQVVESLTVIAPALPYPVRLIELEGETEFECWEGVSVACLPLAHWIPCLGYRVTVRRKPVFNPDKAAALGIPRTLYRVLHAGEPVTLPDGRVISPAQVLDGERAPISLCYCTDTRPVEAIADFARGCSLLISEGMYGDDALRDKADGKCHMLFSDSAKLAQRAGARRLWLTHYSPALTDPQSWLGAARAWYPQAEAGRDGMRIDLND